MKKENYRNLIDPELRIVARKLPFDPWMIKMAAKAQTLLLKMIPVPKEVNWRTFSIEGYKDLAVPIEVFEPKEVDEKLPCLLYIHGGGFGYKAAPHHKKLACAYAKEVNCRVVFPDYHLLPAFPYPAAYTDVLSVYKWICSHSQELQIDVNHIAVAGDSAGGALTANLCNTIEQYNLPEPCFQLLIYPVADAQMQTESMKMFRDTPLWNSVNNQKMWNMYLVGATSQERELASPMQNVLPKRVPDTYIETAEFDCLRDEGLLYAEKLRVAGANVEVCETKKTIHGYDAATNSSITKASVKRRVEVLKNSLWR